MCEYMGVSEMKDSFMYLDFPTKLHGSIFFVYTHLKSHYLSTDKILIQHNVVE